MALASSERGSTLWFFDLKADSPEEAQQIIPFIYGLSLEPKAKRRAMQIANGMKSIGTSATT